MEETALREMSLPELRALRQDIEATIRAKLRAQRLAKEPASAQPGANATEAKPQVSPNVTLLDLERERDAWIASRKA